MAQTVILGVAAFILYGTLALSRQLPWGFRLYVAGTALFEAAGWAVWWTAGPSSVAYMRVYVGYQLWLSWGVVAVLVAVHRRMRGSGGRLAAWVAKVGWAAWTLFHLGEWSQFTAQGWAVKAGEMAFAVVLATLLLEGAKMTRIEGAVVFGLGLGTLAREAALQRLVMDRGAWEATAQLVDLLPWVICCWGLYSRAGTSAAAATAARLKRTATRLLPAKWRRLRQGELF